MDLEDEAHTRLLEALLPSSFSTSASVSPTARLQEDVASLHSAALHSRESPAPYLEYLSQTLATFSLHEPVTLHPTTHSANTQTVLSHLKDADPSILHVHSPAHKPIFPHHLHCTESYLPLSSHTEAASLIASSLRDAVSAKEPITLVILHLDATNSLLPALPVAHALADRFNGRVHATGPGCLSAFRGMPLATHSVGIDLGAALGVRGCGYVTFGVQELKDGYGADLLPFAVCMRYILERFTLTAIKKVLDGIVRVVEGVGDALYRVEALWQVDILAEGEARIRYKGEDARQVEKVVVVNDKTGLLELSDGILISAAAALRRHRMPPENAVRMLCELLIRVSREYELAKLARSAFVARLRQCEHVETQQGEGLVLSALSVVPLGHVPPAGKWRRNEDARRIVEDCTKKFVVVDGDEDVVVVKLSDEGNEDGAKAIVSPRINCAMDDGIENWQMAEECERLAQQLLFDEASARSWGVRAADVVVQRVIALVDRIDVAVDREERDGVKDVEEEAERGPDGTVEVVEAKDMSNEGDHSGNAQAEETNVSGGNDDDNIVHTTGESPVQDGTQELLKQHGESGAQEEAVSATERTGQNGDTRPKSRPGLWGLIFGDNDATETESEESSEDVDGKQLEDDYFRP